MRQKLPDDLQEQRRVYEQMQVLEAKNGSTQSCLQRLEEKHLGSALVLTDNISNS